MLLAEASSAICVQRFDDSRNSAIHTTYRISLRSSSLREPRYPLLRVVLFFSFQKQNGRTLAECIQDRAFTLSLLYTSTSVLPILTFFASAFWFSVCLVLYNILGRNRKLFSSQSYSIKRYTRTACPFNYSSRVCVDDCVAMILPQVHLRKPCYDFSFL